MLILVAVTLNIALDDNGIIAKTKEARAKQEKASIYDKIVAALVYDREGVDLQASYQNIKKTLNDQGYTVTMDPNDFRSITEVDFTVTVSGKYAEAETYKIAKNGITENSIGIPPEPSNPYTFTLGDLDEALKSAYGEQNGLASKYIYYTSTENEDTEIDLGLFANIPSTEFWGVVGNTLTGQYGVNPESEPQFKLEGRGQLTCSNGNMKFLYDGSMSTLMSSACYAFSFIDGGDSVNIIMINWDGEKITGNSENATGDAETLISTFGEAEFSFVGSQKPAPAPIVGIEVGKYVWYDYNNNQVKDSDETWRVLYNNSDGIQIYSVNGLGEYSIGDNSSLSNTISQINSAYDNLNDYCRTNYFNSTYATNIRNITNFGATGTNENRITIYDEGSNEYITTAFDTIINQSANMSSDYSVIGITFGADIPDDVITNSRIRTNYGGSDDAINLSNGDNSEIIIFNRTTNVIRECNQITGKVMPVVTLNSNLSITSGLGTEESPYVLSVSQ